MTMIAVAVVLLALVALGAIWKWASKKKVIEKFRSTPVIVPTREDGKRALAGLREMDLSKWEPPSDVTPLEILLRATTAPDGIHVAVGGVDANGTEICGLMMPICARRIVTAIEETVQRLPEADPLLRGNLADNVVSDGEPPVDMGEIGGFDLYSRAEKGVFLLLQNMTGQSFVFGPMQLGDVKIAGHRLREAMAGLDPLATQKSVVKLDFTAWKKEMGPREVYEAGTGKRLALGDVPSREERRAVKIRIPVDARAFAALRVDAPREPVRAPFHRGIVATT